MGISMQHAKRKEVHRIEFLPDLDMIFLGVLATLTIQAFRTGAHKFPLAVWIETCVLMALPLIWFWWATLSSKSLNKTAPPKRPNIYQLQAGAFAMVGFCLVAQWISRRCGLGDANEIVALLAVNYAAWFLLVFSKFGNLGRTGFLLACTLVLFVCFSAESTAVFVWAFFFAILALWRMLGNYWNRVNSKALDGQSETLAVNGIALLITMLVVSLTGLVVWSVVPRDSMFLANGFAAFSGGTNGEQNEYAIKGVGDGNMLAAGANATTTGAVESDQFIEDDKPSIYDMVSDTYEGPVKVRKENNRAVALAMQAKHLHNVVQSEQSGKAFRTVRERPTDKKIDLKSKITKALFYVEGSVPARFTMDCFHEFDGWDWSKVTLDAQDHEEPSISLKRLNGKPWYVVDRVADESLSSQRTHRVKIMRLSTETLPASSLAAKWHIHRMNIRDLFCWNEQGIIKMNGSIIPTQTMIDVVSHVPNYHILRSNRSLGSSNQNWNWADGLPSFGTAAGTTSVNPVVTPANPDSPFIQMPENESRQKLKSLIEKVTKGHRAGWNQVEAIVNHFRQNFELDPNLVASDQGDDSVGSFLTQGGGPSYLFASTATQALRSAGYRARLASGFLVQRKDFDRQANQSIVTGENLHMWPEVSLDGSHWIPVEPTPGLPVPYSHQTTWQFVKSTLIGFFKIASRNPIASLSLVSLIVLAYKFWSDLTVALSWGVWSIVVTTFPSRRLIATRRLLDIRFRAAGIPRPEFATIFDWFSRVDRKMNNDFFTYWQISNFSNQVTDGHAVSIACQQISRDLSFPKIKHFAKKHAGVDT